MPRLEGRANVPGSHFRKIMSMRPEIAKSWTALDEAMRFTGLLHPALKEEVRRMVAQYSGCAFCASLGKPIGTYDDPRLAAAVAYGRALAEHPTSVDDAIWDALKTHFSDEEVVELTAWVAFMFASEMIGGIMKLDPATPELLTMYTKWIQGGIDRYPTAAE
jgi:alkylhydroperoxidase family enzyme